MTIEEALIAIIPVVAKLLEAAISGESDEQAQLQAILNMQRALADARAKSALAAAGT